MSKSPEALLNRAADRLEELAEATFPGPWTVLNGKAEGFSDGFILVTDDTYTGVEVDPEGRAEADWVAALSPAVAAPLAKWLRSEARTVRLDIMGSGDTPVTWRYVASRYGPAIEFAKLITGETE